MKKKITLFFPNYLRGGLENSLLRISELLVLDKYDIKIIGNNINKNNFKHLQNLEIVNINEIIKKSIFNKFLNHYLFKLIISSFICAKYSKTILTFQSPYILIILNFFYKNIIFIRESSLIELSTKKKLFMKIIKKLSWNFAHHIFCISKESQKVNSKYLNYKHGNISTLYNPINFENLKKKANIKINFKKKNNVIYFVTVARLSSEKNINYIIELLSLFKGKLKFQLNLIGDGEEKYKLQNLIKHYNLTKEISIKGFMENPYPIIKNSDYFILFSEYEGFGNVYLESLVLKTPVITWKAPCGPSEILEYGKSGLLLNYKSSSKINSRLILKYIQNLEFKRKQLKNSVNHIKKFRKEKTIDIFNRTYIKYNKKIV